MDPKKRLESLKRELTWTDSINVLCKLIGDEKVDKAIRAHEKEIQQLEEKLNGS